MSHGSRLERIKLLGPSKEGAHIEGGSTSIIWTYNDLTSVVLTMLYVDIKTWSGWSRNMTEMAGIMLFLGCCICRHDNIVFKLCHMFDSFT